ncbi:MAG: helix-hairpin-helix domain-containing protein [Pseudomonadales bacterium]|nr:helix-hairpin-helix domain-containing protein [Pseudomonadales bacterium]
MARPVSSVKGIGSVAAQTLLEHGITSVEELAAMSVEQLSLVPGFSTALSTRVIAQARNMVAPGGKESTDANGGPSATSPDAESSAKGKGRGKGKGKGKDKEQAKGNAKAKAKGKAKGKAKVKTGSKGSSKENTRGKKLKKKDNTQQGKTTAPEAVVSKKTAILIKLLTRQIEARKAKIAKHTRKLERLERALREAPVKYRHDRARK